MTRVVAAAPAFPPHRYPQQEITDAFAAAVLGPSADRRVLDRLHRAAGVGHRHLALPLAEYAGRSGLGAAADAFLRVGTELAARAVTDALDAVELGAADVDVVMSTSITGVAAPSIEARLVPRIGLRQDVRRIPLFGLGCVAGAAGIARLHDVVRAEPDAVAVLVSVELCSLTLQREDTSTANLVSGGLFGDGAAAVVLVGDRRAEALGLAGPSVLGTRSRLYPGTERVMGWDVVDGGFRIVLDAGVAALVREHLGADVTAFLGDHGSTVADVHTWLAHPGGPKVLDAVVRALDLPEGALDLSWQSLAEVGNLSSASVLDVLSRAFAGPRPDPGSLGVLLALGPGFCSELVLLRW